jgi:hypothetical protein
LDHKFMALCKKLDITIEEEESSDEAGDNTPKPKRPKVEMSYVSLPTILFILKICNNF